MLQGFNALVEGLLYTIDLPLFFRLSILLGMQHYTYQYFGLHEHTTVEIE